MPRYAIFFIFLVISCSQAYIEETQDVVNIPITTSYNDSTDGILVEWESQWDYVTTDVYRGLSPYELHAYKSGVSTSVLMDYDANPGVEYYYQIRAYNSKGRNIGLSSVSAGYRSYRSIDDVVKPTDLQSAKDLASDSIKFYWSGNVLDSFRIYRKKGTSVNSSDGFVLYDTVNFDFNGNLMYIDTDIEFGETYSYTVSAVGQDSSKVVSEKRSDEFVTSTTKDSPEGVVASYRDPLISGGIEVSWDRKLGDEYYNIYRATSEHGEYVLIYSFEKDNTFIDRNLPDTAGTWINNKYEYPTYYYKITSGFDSGYSSAAAGQAIAKSDLLDPPSDFALQFNSTDFTLTFTWNTPEGIDNEDYYYKFIRYDENNNTNVLLNNSKDLSDVVDLGYENANTYTSFGKYYVYEVVTVNNAIDIAGVPSQLSYTHTTPGIAKITNITHNKKEVITNTTTPNTDVVVYYGDDSDSVGTITKEWYTTTSVGFIDVKWQKYHQLEQIAHYEVHRRVQGSGDEFKIVAEVDGTEYRDRNFTDAEMLQTHEYKVVAVNFLDVKGAESSVVGNGLAYSNYKQEDILPAPSYLSIPAHWARKKKSFIGSYSEVSFSSTWAVGYSSPAGADKIKGQKGSGQHLYLVWDDVADVNYYTAKVNNNAISSYTPSTTAYTMVDNTSGTGKTGFYNVSTFKDSSVEEATFTVAPVNSNGVTGDERGVIFKQVIFD